MQSKMDVRTKFITPSRVKSELSSDELPTYREVWSRYFKEQVIIEELFNQVTLQNAFREEVGEEYEISNIEYCSSTQEQYSRW
jgi:hypothetical protein